MDVVHLAAKLFEILVQEGLHGSDTQLLFGMRNGDEAGLALVVVGKHMALALTLIAVGIELLQLGHEMGRLHTEEHAVDGLKLQGIIVVVYHFYQGITGGQCQVFLGCFALLLLLIAGLRGSQRVVAVAHGEQQRSCAGEVVLSHLCLVGAQAGEGVCHGVDLGIGQLVALDMAAVLHQVKVIHHFHLIGSGGKGLDNGLLGVVDEQHHMGQLNGSVAAHTGAGRNAILHGGLGGTDEGAGAGGKIIGVQVHHTHQTMTDLAVGLLTLDVDQGVGQGLEHAVSHVLVHGLVDLRDELVHIGSLQIGLGQDQAQSGGCVAHLLLHSLPVLRLGSELVAGHHGPLGHVAILGHQNVSGIEAQLFKLFVHLVPPCICKNAFYQRFLLLLCIIHNSVPHFNHFSARNRKKIR